MREVNVISAGILDSFPQVDESRVDALLAGEIEKSSRKIIVLDDDPTGVQTVHHISVYTDWSIESIREGFAETQRLFYLLTNSRGFTVEQTTAAHREIAARAAAVSRETGISCLIMSRGDSTLRGHYPLETELLKAGAEAAGQRIDGEILCPFFREGGRFTIGDIHYVRDGDRLIPAGQTEFAKDRTFGYRSSDLKDYVEEKTDGAYPAEQVVSISIEELRKLDLDGIERKLLGVCGFGKVVVNAAADVDVKIFSIALYRAMAKGKNFLFRTAAALVRAFGEISSQPLLTREQMIHTRTPNGGVIVVGSHTQKTTRQLDELKKAEGIVPVEFNSDLVLDESAFAAETARTTRKMEEIIRSGKTAVVYTKRKLLVIENDSPEDALLRSVRISNAVQALVGDLRETPAFVIAKGGITSSDIGTKALKVRRALVMGQIRPGIPVWRTGAESRFPGIPYVIFPGNVGEDTTLREAAEILMKSR